MRWSVSLLLATFACATPESREAPTRDGTAPEAARSSVDMAAFALDCTVDTDCAAVNASPCGPCGCSTTPLRTADLAKFRAAVGALRCPPAEHYAGIDCGGCAAEVARCEAGKCKVGEPPSDRTELSGTILVEGKPVDLATASLHRRATRCTEPDLARIEVRFEPAPGLGAMLSIAGDPTSVRLGERMMPRTADEPSKVQPVSIAIWASATEKLAASHQLPKAGWVRFDELDPAGPLGFEFEADFGDLGNVRGRVGVPRTEATVCRVPAPP